MCWPGQAAAAGLGGQASCLHVGLWSRGKHSKSPAEAGSCYLQGFVIPWSSEAVVLRNPGLWSRLEDHDFLFTTRHPLEARGPPTVHAWLFIAFLWVWLRPLWDCLEDVCFMAHLEDSPWVCNMVSECWVILYLFFEAGYFPIFAEGHFKLLRGISRYLYVTVLYLEDSRVSCS